MIKATLALSAMLALILSGCSHGQCNNVPQRQTAADSGTPAGSEATASGQPGGTTVGVKTGADVSNGPAAERVGIGGGAPAGSVQNPNPSGDNVQVFKPTGEKQCEEGTGVSLDNVKNTLTSKKIPVYEAHTQSDGMMHMALCGTPKGNIHVFTISKKNQKKAEKLGFKEFKLKQ